MSNDNANTQQSANTDTSAAANAAEAMRDLFGGGETQAPLSPQEQQSFVPLHQSGEEDDEIYVPNAWDKVKSGTSSFFGKMGQKLKPVGEQSHRDTAEKVGSAVERSVAETMHFLRGTAEVLTGSAQGLLTGIMKGTAGLSPAQIKLIRTRAGEGNIRYMGRVVEHRTVQASGGRVGVVRVDLDYDLEGNACPEEAWTEIQTTAASRTEIAMPNGTKQDAVLVPMRDSSNTTVGYAAIVELEGDKPAVVFSIRA
jgi:hypothetical protein